MFSPVASLDRKESGFPPKGVPAVFPEMKNAADFDAEATPRAQSGRFQPQAGVGIDCVSRATQPFMDTGSDISVLEWRSRKHSISADGNQVVFESNAGNLVLGQKGTNGVFVYDRITGVIELVSRATGTTTTVGNNISLNPVLSANGQFVAFLSAATDLVPGQVDTNQAFDVFLFDRSSGTTQLVSRAVGTTTVTGNAGNGNIEELSISSDGRWVAFESGATNLVPNQIDTTVASDLFVFDRLSGVTQLVSRVAGTIATGTNSDSRYPMLSSDGRFLVYQSWAINLVPGQVNISSGDDVFVFDVETGTNQLVSRAAGTTTTTGNQISFDPWISENGQWITFSSSATNLVTDQNDTNQNQDVFLFNRVSGTIELVSRAAGALTTTGNAWAGTSSVSQDGTWVVFESRATNLVLGLTDANSVHDTDIFLYNRLSGVIKLVSQAAGTSSMTGDAVSRFPRMSASGQWITFQSYASNLVPGQTSSSPEYFSLNVFLYDQTSETTQLVSRVAGTSTVGANSLSEPPVISQNGQIIAFGSQATNLVSGLTDFLNRDVFVFDRSTQITTVASRHAFGAACQTGLGKSSLDFTWHPLFSEALKWESENRQSVSRDGRYVVFSSTAPNLVPDQSMKFFDFYNVFVRDLITQTTTLVSREVGTQATEANRYSNVPALSADGRWIVYASLATNLVSGQVDNNNDSDVFLYDRQTGITELVSRGAGTLTTTGNSYSGAPSISADGRFITFLSQSTNLVIGLVKRNSLDDVFVYDRLTQTTELVSRAAGTTTTTGNSISTNPTISEDGKFIVFQSQANDLVPGQIGGTELTNIFVYDRIAGITKMVSRVAGTVATAGNGMSISPRISADGQVITFMSISTNLVPSQIEKNGHSDIFVYDQTSGKTQLVSHAAGTTITTGNFHSFNPAISADGNFITYESVATDLVFSQNDTNLTWDVFVYNRVSGTTELVSRAAGTRTTTGNQKSVSPTISGNGQFVAFESIATNLVPGQTDTSGTTDIFVFDRINNQIRLVSGVNGSPSITVRGITNSPQISQNGQYIVFQSYSNNLIPDDYNNNLDVFVAEVFPPVTATLAGGGTICTSQSTTLTATVVGGTPPYTLTLTNGGGTQTGNSPLSFTVSPLTTTTYAIQSGTDASGNPVTGTGNATVTVNFCTELPALLVADTTNNRIQRFNGTTWSVVGPGTVGSGTGQFRAPEAVVFNQAGRIYVADTGNNRIQWSTNGGTTWAIFAANGSGLNQVSGPRGLALDQSGNLYVADGGNNRVVRFNNGIPGNAVILATNGTTSGRVQNPNGLAIDTTFSLFIADTGNNRIQKITSASTQTVPNTGTVIAGIGSGLTSVRMPQGVAIDSVGNLYVADTGNNRITRFAGGNPGTATVLAGSGTALGQVRAPEGVTISAFSTGPLAGGLSLIVSDTSNNRIQGRLLNATIWGLVGTPNGLGSSPGQFRAPSKIR